MLARTSRRSGSTLTNNVTATCLERISHSTVAVALCFLLAVNFYTERIFRSRFFHSLASSNCLSDSANDTVSPPTVRSFPMKKDNPDLSHRHPFSLHDPTIKQRLVSDNNLSVLQSPVDMEFTVVRRNAKVLLLPRVHANSSLPFHFSKPWLKTFFTACSELPPVCVFGGLCTVALPGSDAREKLHEIFVAHKMMPNKHWTRSV